MGNCAVTYANDCPYTYISNTLHFHLQWKANYQNKRNIHVYEADTRKHNDYNCWKNTTILYPTFVITIYRIMGINLGRKFSVLVLPQYRKTLYHISPRLCHDMNIYHDRTNCNICKTNIYILFIISLNVYYK